MGRTMHGSHTQYLSSFWCAAVLLVGAVRVASAESPLVDAAERNDLAAVRAQLDAKANVNQAQADGMTAIHWAAYHNDADTVKLLLTAGADAKASNRYGVTPLSIACEEGSAPIVEALVTAGADADASLPSGETMLMIAARTGNVATVKALLSHGASVDAVTRKGQTALMWAAAEGNVDVVDVLLKAGANYRTTMESGFSPLFFAVREGRTKVVSRLLQTGEDVNRVLTASGKPTNALLLAVENGHFALAADLLNAGADANSHPAGYTALHAITWVRKPIRGDGDPPPYGSGKLTSLELVRKLVEYKADINARLEKGATGRGKFNMNGSTPFLLAARTSDVPLLQLLINLGADTTLSNVDECTPLLAAAGVGALSAGDEAAGTEEEALETVRLLLKLGAAVNDVDKNGETAMHGAAYQSRSQVVRLLAANDADVDVWNRTNKLGWTPLMIAQGHQPENFRLSPETVAALNDALGVEREKTAKK